MFTLHNTLSRASISPLELGQLRRGFFVLGKMRHHSLWKSSSLVAAASILQILLPGCDKTDIGTVDTRGSAPYVSGAVIAPESINIDALTPAGGLYTVSTDVSVKVTGADGTNGLHSVTAEVVRPKEESSFLSATLHDDGQTPDQTGGDGIYSGKLQFSLTRASAGRYRIQFIALDNSGLYGNILEKSLNIRRNNSPPRLSNLVAPDTITLPVGSSMIVRMTIGAADSDGIADIQQVYFRSLVSTTPDFKFLLKDDGGTDPVGAPLFVASGDSVSGDGIYSIQIPLRDSPTVRRTNIFAFQAVDTFGDTSATLIHYLVVR